MGEMLTQLPYLIGKRAAEKAIDVTTGQTTAAVERTNLLVLTKAVLELNSEPLLKYVK